MKQIYLYADRIAELLEQDGYGERTEIRQQILDFVEIIKFSKAEYELVEDEDDS